MKTLPKEKLARLLELEETLRRHCCEGEDYFSALEEIAVIYQGIGAKGGNQRKFQRLSLLLTVSMLVDKREITSSINDLSLGGFCLMEPVEMLPDFNRFILHEISYGAKTFVVDAWCEVIRPIFMNRRPNDRKQIGVEFVFDDQEEKNRVYQAFDTIYLQHLRDLLDE